MLNCRQSNNLFYLINVSMLNCRQSNNLFYLINVSMLNCRQSNNLFYLINVSMLNLDKVIIYFILSMHQCLFVFVNTPYFKMILESRFIQLVSGWEIRKEKK